MIKLCGIKKQEEINTIASLQDKFTHIGFIFYKKSKRFCDNFKNLDLSQVKNTVGVFVRPSARDVINVLKLNNLNYIQFHGEERQKKINKIKKSVQRQLGKKIKTIKTIAVKNKDEISNKKLEELLNHNDYILLDTPTIEHGGSGQSFDWNLIKNIKNKDKIILSGGIDKNNILQALILSKNIDLSSGIESVKGVKDIEKIKELYTII